ncbi:MAG TPA: hypothetical protein VMF06_06395 [Candidatus Limnocylindria bacterium]|jgi:O-antigen ligase|nr:hypothetical protein [Candidatus Limnocylindria bacterium]
MSPLEARDRFVKVAVLGVVSIAAIIFAFILSTSQGLVVLAIMGTFWVASLPKHAELCMNVATATLAAGLLVPFLPGRPLIWEAAGLLGWSGMLFRIALRRYHPNFGAELKRNILVIFCMAFYSAVLVFLMRHYGVGFGSFGSADAGGRRYVTQLICAIFPLVYLLLLPSEKTITYLFIWQCILSLSYIPSEFIVNYGRGASRYLLLFFEASSDAWDFANVGANYGLRRVQAFYIVTAWMSSLLLVFVPLRKFFTFRGAWAAVVGAALVVVGGLSGHRYTLYSVAALYSVVGWVQRLYRPIYLSVLVPLVAAFVVTAYVVAPSVPESMQRVLTVLPGIRVGSRAYMDAEAGLEGRRLLWRHAMNIAPKYLWVGRGYGVSADADLTRKYDNTESLASNGIFYNGTLGLLVNSGIPGLVSMMAVVLFGFAICWRVFRYVRKYRWEDRFALVCTVLSANYVTIAFSFIFLHGDSEYAMKAFCPHLGLLMACEYRLRLRDREARGLGKEFPEAAVEVIPPAVAEARERLLPVGGRV